MREGGRQRLYRGRVLAMPCPGGAGVSVLPVVCRGHLLAGNATLLFARQSDLASPGVRPAAARLSPAADRPNCAALPPAAAGAGAGKGLMYQERLEEEEKEQVQEQRVG